ncbi:O-antigen ligase family protein [Paraflavitalea pollutisoli]|uniref:O-antigen ligase family protein n=1 Tax=Paraflavitalea pollutisoli TaxID=3034143 RepID=UPI0023ECFEC5|nr:O-antigen ligase family protein [Paraflavitalea sp. H1-2-19X]
MPYLSKENSIALLTKLKLFLLWGIGFTIVFSLLNLNSIFLVSLTGAWLLQTLLEGTLYKKLDRLRKDRLFVAYILYFLVETSGLLHATDLGAGLKNFESKLAFLALPVVFCTSVISKDTRKQVLTGFTIAVTVASLYCLLLSVKFYLQQHSTELFYYHGLVSHLDHHAVYFSVFIFISFIYLLLNTDVPDWLANRKWFRIIWMSFYFVLLILLASKMLLIILIPVVLYVTLNRFSHISKQKLIVVTSILLVLGLTAIFATNNPIRKRFADLQSTKLTFLQQEKYSPGEYFNGIELRLLLWRFTYEILTEKKAWLFGLSPSDAQPALKQKYLAVNMYAGDGKSNQGYLVFNCHNQYLQTTLQSGLLGLAALLFWCFALVAQAVRKKDLLLNALVTVLLIFFFSESVFERQYGIILCTFFPLFLLYSQRSLKEKALS